jgi:poly-gamma-glutamate synthesis protein (capsule biosynthesis protein)
VRQAQYVGLPGFLARAAWGAADLLGVSHRRAPEAAGWGKLYGVNVRFGAGLGLRRGHRVARRDLEANLASVREASAKADPVVFSIHAHDQGEWLTELAHKVIDAGADVFFAHGPHQTLGIEIYKGKPVLYGLGDFVFQLHAIERFPSEFYDAFGLGDDAAPADVQAARAAKGLGKEREAWEAVAAVVRFRGGTLQELRLLPLDLGFDQLVPGEAPPADHLTLGKPRLAADPLAWRIIGRIAELSRPYGTAIHYLEDEHAGIVDLTLRSPAEIGRLRPAPP